VLGSITMGLHHKLCHTLGASFNLPHAETHAVILPHALAYNAPAAPEAMARIARALGAPGDAPGAVFDLGARHGAPTALAAVGMRAENLDRRRSRAAERISEPAPARAWRDSHAAPARVRRHTTGLSARANRPRELPR
jgi:maleylacetate reductase